MMHETSNLRTSKRIFVNWGIIWGIIFGLVFLDLYFDSRQKNTETTTYRSQYHAKAKEADSLQVVKNQLEQELLKIKSTQ